MDVPKLFIELIYLLGEGITSLSIADSIADTETKF
jgi:hypothetical protein